MRQVIACQVNTSNAIIKEESATRETQIACMHMMLLLMVQNKYHHGNIFKNKIIGLYSIYHIHRTGFNE